MVGRQQLQILEAADAEGSSYGAGICDFKLKK